MAISHLGSRCCALWAWTDRMNQTSLIPIFKKWVPMPLFEMAISPWWQSNRRSGFKRIFSSPYCPEPNLCERVFEWLRTKIEGEVYKSLEHKHHVIGWHLRRMSSHNNSLNQLVDWEWIRIAFGQATAIFTGRDILAPAS